MSDESGFCKGLVGVCTGLKDFCRDLIGVSQVEDLSEDLVGVLTALDLAGVSTDLVGVPVLLEGVFKFLVGLSELLSGALAVLEGASIFDLAGRWGASVDFSGNFTLLIGVSGDLVRAEFVLLDVSIDFGLFSLEVFLSDFGIGDSLLENQEKMLFDGDG